MREEFLNILDGQLRFDCPQLAFCTHYSWFGIVKQDRLGIEETHLFYNRRPALLSPALLTFEVESRSPTTDLQSKRSNRPLSIEETTDGGFHGRAAFLDTDILCYHASLDSPADVSSVRARFLLPATEPTFQRKARFDAQDRILTIEARTPATDPRDPDPHHRLTICLILPKAFAIGDIIAGGLPVSGLDNGFQTAEALEITLTASAADFEGNEQTFVLGIGEGPSAGEIERRVRYLAGFDSERASLAWLDDGLGGLTFDGIAPEFRLHYAKAAYQLLCNAKAPRGRIKHRASYPSRGTYCAHYLWDACFTNLGVSQFNQELAEGFLRVLCENQEADGKIPHFVCATWNRPGESQPPLIAWSAWRLYEQFGNKDFIRDVYRPLELTVDWWFAARDADRDGLAEYEHRLESGWDDSPRFARGRIAAVDLNAYLNREMRLLANMATILGKGSDGRAWQARASLHAKHMLARLFDPEDGIFYDRLVAENSLHKVLTPASFTPLWAEVELPSAVGHEMIARYLINPKHFFGSQLFPVVAYSDPNYLPDKWWRGPVWPNIAWAMTEVLRRHGFDTQHHEAVRRLARMMAQHDELNELYSSATGQPLGAPGLCWGDAIFMALAREIGE